MSDSITGYILRVRATLAIIKVEAQRSRIDRSRWWCNGEGVAVWRRRSEIYDTRDEAECAAYHRAHERAKRARAAAERWMAVARKYRGAE